MAKYDHPEAVAALVRDREVHKDCYIDDEIFALEMEHLFLRRSDGKAFGPGTVEPACLSETAVPQSVGQAPISRAIRRARSSAR